MEGSASPVSWALGSRWCLSRRVYPQCPTQWHTSHFTGGELWMKLSPACFLLVGVKLGMRSIPIATACTIYHKFFCEINLDAYDPYLVAMSSLYLAGKVEEQHLRTRDIINVSNR